MQHRWKQPLPAPLLEPAFWQIDQFDSADRAHYEPVRSKEPAHLSREPTQGGNRVKPLRYAPTARVVRRENAQA